MVIYRKETQFWAPYNNANKINTWARNKGSGGVRMYIKDYKDNL